MSHDQDHCKGLRKRMLPRRDARWARRELLSRSPLFAGLAPTLLDALTEASHLLELPADHFLYRAGEPVRDAHLLISGTVKRSVSLTGQAKKVLELVQSQQLLALGEVFSAQRYGTSGKTVTPCIIVAINAHRLHTLVSQDLELSGRLIQTLARQHSAMEFDMTGYHYGLTGTQRVLDYLVGLAGDSTGLAGETTVTLSTSKKNIAARVGMTPETFSRSLRLLSDSGVIVVEGRKVHIQNAALLNTHAGPDHQRVSFPRKPKTKAGVPGKSVSPGALVNICGRLRVLSQRMAIAWAQIGRNIAAARARVKLHQLEVEFERTLARLHSLDLPADLGAPLTRVKRVWPPYRQALFDLAPDLAHITEVFDLSEELLEATDQLTHQAAIAGGSPDALYVNIAGRNRMISQRIGKFFLFQEWGLQSDALLREQAASRQEFARNLTLLQHSASQVPELAAQLQEIADLWQKFQRVQQPDLAYSNKARHALAVLAAGARLLRHVDTAVKLYERLAPAAPTAPGAEP